MRKFLIAALAAAAALAVAGIAYAANTYTVDGNTKPVVKGSAKKPKPVSLSFEYTVRDVDRGQPGHPGEAVPHRRRGPGDLSGGVPGLSR